MPPPKLDNQGFLAKAPPGDERIKVKCAVAIFTEYQTSSELSDYSNLRQNLIRLF